MFIDAITKYIDFLFVKRFSMFNEARVPHVGFVVLRISMNSFVDALL